MRRGGPVPLYYQILQVLRGRIAGAEYSNGGPLPTDEALTREFGVSRHTVRAALQQLVVEGLVERFPGRGSFVRDGAAAEPTWTIEAVEDLIERSFADTYRVLSARRAPARDHRRAAEALRVPGDAALFHLRAVRSTPKGPYSYSHVYFPIEIGEKLPRHLLNQRPLILLVEEYAGRPAFRTRQVALAAAADREAERFLKVRLGDPLLVLERTHYDREDRPIEHGRIQYRPDRYQQVVSFSRRQEPPYLPPPSLLDRRRAPRSIP